MLYLMRCSLCGLPKIIREINIEFRAYLYLVINVTGSAYGIASIITLNDFYS